VQYDSLNRCWKLFEGARSSVVATRLEHRIPSFGFIISEKPSPGKLDAVKLLSKGISPGPIFGKLKSGQSVVLECGEVLNPADFVQPDIPGRKIVILGDTCDSSEIFSHAQNTDVLVHEATMENRLKDKCIEYGHSTPDMAVDVAVKSGTRTLILFHLSPRYKPGCVSGDGDSAQVIYDEAINRIAEYGKTDMKLIVAEDFTQYEIPKKL